MEIVNIEAQTFEAMMTRLEQFIQRVDELCCRYGGREKEKWLTGQDVCMILNISKRTLQYLRDSGRLAYTQINRQMYYKPEDVERLITCISK